jgi:hypothetical protein
MFLRIRAALIDVRATIHGVDVAFSSLMLIFFPGFLLYDGSHTTPVEAVREVKVGRAGHSWKMAQGSRGRWAKRT